MKLYDIIENNTETDPVSLDLMEKDTFVIEILKVEPKDSEPYRL